MLMSLCFGILPVVCDGVLADLSRLPAGISTIVEIGHLWWSRVRGHDRPGVLFCGWWGVVFSIHCSVGRCLLCVSASSSMV